MCSIIFFFFFTLSVSMSSIFTCETQTHRLILFDYAQRRRRQQTLKLGRKLAVSFSVCVCVYARIKQHTHTHTNRSTRNIILLNKKIKKIHVYNRVVDLEHTQIVQCGSKGTTITRLICIIFILQLPVCALKIALGNNTNISERVQSIIQIVIIFEFLKFHSLHTRFVRALAATPLQR